MLHMSLVEDLVTTFLDCEDIIDRRRFYKYLIDEAIFDIGGEDYVIAIMSMESIDDFHKLDEDMQKCFVNAFLKANIVTKVRKTSVGTYYVSDGEEE